jgi:hypothetical protein
MYSLIYFRMQFTSNTNSTLVGVNFKKKMIFEARKMELRIIFELNRIYLSEMENEER